MNSSHSTRFHRVFSPIHKRKSQDKLRRCQPWKIPSNRQRFLGKKTLDDKFTICYICYFLFLASASRKTGQILQLTQAEFQVNEMLRKIIQGLSFFTSKETLSYKFNDDVDGRKKKEKYPVLKKSYLNFICNFTVQETIIVIVKMATRVNIAKQIGTSVGPILA